MDEKNSPVLLDEISRERMEKMGIDASGATHEEILRFAAVAQAHYLRKIRFWVMFIGIVVLVTVLFSLPSILSVL